MLFMLSCLHRIIHHSAPLLRELRVQYVLFIFAAEHCQVGTEFIPYPTVPVMCSETSYGVIRFHWHIFLVTSSTPKGVN